MDHSPQHVASHGWDYADDFSNGRNEAHDEESTGDENASYGDTSSDDEESDASSVSTASDNNSCSSENYDEEDDATSSSNDNGEDRIDRLERNDPTLTEICLHHQEEWFPTNNAEWANMGHILGDATHLSDLGILNNISGEAISMTDEWALYSGLQHNRSIQNLHFTGPLPGMFTSFVHPSNQFWRRNTFLVDLGVNGLELGRQDMKQLCSVVTKLKNLAALGITHCWSRDGDCFLGEDDDLFSIFLRTLVDMKNHPLKSLELQGNAIGSDSMNNLVWTIQRCCPDLEELNLQDTNIGHRSCDPLASLLRNPSSRLSSLDLWSCSMDDDCAVILADALRHNKSLQFMSLGRNNFTAKGRKAFSTLLCNKSSIEERFSSNHTLECLGSNDELSVHHLLALNLSDDKRAMAMNKVVKFHLSELLVIMGVKLLPNIMTTLGAKQKDSCHESCRLDLLSAMFSIVRNTPALFQYVSADDGNQDVFDIVDGLEKMRFDASVSDLTVALDRGLSV